MLTVYAISYGNGNDVVELVQHEDGRVGLWDVKAQQWREMWGSGTNHTGFVNAITNWDGALTGEGRLWMAKRKSR